MIHLGRGLLYGIGLLSLTQHATAQDWDGPSVYPYGLAPDVTAEPGWNSSFPKFEGISGVYPPLINGTDGDGDDEPDIASRAAQDFYLRLMPLGASITQGVQSSDGNGFRKLLRQQLRWKGWKVNMVGTKQNGNMVDNVRERKSSEPK